MVSKHSVLSTTVDNLKLGYDTLGLNCERWKHWIDLEFLLSRLLIAE